MFNTSIFNLLPESQFPSTPRQIEISRRNRSKIQIHTLRFTLHALHHITIPEENSREHFLYQVFLNIKKIDKSVDGFDQLARSILQITVFSQPMNLISSKRYILLLPSRIEPLFINLCFKFQFLLYNTHCNRFS